jgi:hypothetical protein
MSQIEEFNRIRRILYSTFHKGEKGQAAAFEYLEGYRKKLDPRSYVGLKAELGFYQKNRKEFSLTVAADVGDHTDFSGFMAKEPFRFDITTNADYKKLKDYEPLQKDIDAKYKIVVVNHSGDIEDLIDINFPFCPECEEGRLIDTAVLLPENYNDKGESKWTNDQVLVGVCNYCQYFEEYNRISTHFLFDFNTEINNALESERDRLEYLESIGKKPIFDADKVIIEHSKRVLPYLHRQFDKSIMALADKSYKITNPKDGDGYNCLQVQWRKDLKLLDDYIHDEYEIDID